MRRRLLDFLMGIAAAAMQPSPSSAAAVSVLNHAHHTQPPPQHTFYINKPANSDREIAAAARAQSAIPSRQQAERRLVFDASDSRTGLDDWVLEDYVLVATIEGNLYALDRYSGATRWVLDGQGAAVQAVGSRYFSDPLNTTKQSSSSTDQRPRWIVQPVEGGQLFLFDQEFGVLELPLTIKQLVDHGAFKIPGDDKVYTGKKETQFIAVDSKTGKVLSQYGTPSAAFLGAKCRGPRDVFDELDDECDATVDSRDILMIGKTVYHLTITSAEELTWDVTYTEWTPNMVDSHLTDQYVKVQDDLYICPSSDGQVYMHNPTHETALWTKNLASSAINAFDVFRPSFEDETTYKDPPSLVLIRQPPSPYFRKPAEGKVTTFLNTTEEGAWYALSTDRYPLLTSRVQIAPWAEWHSTHDADDKPAEDDANLTKQDLVGIHPIAKTMEMNIDNPGLPAPNIGGLIEGGDWQNAHRTGKLDVVKEHSIWIMIVLVLLLFVIGKRKFLRSRFHGVSRPQPITTTESPTQTNKETTPLTEKINLDGEEGSADGPSSGEGTSAAADDEVPAQPEKKRRKRGQRGGKNNKKKVGFADPDGDDDDQGENGEPNGTVQAVAIPKDIPLNDQGNHNIDGLTVTDNLLGSGSQGTFVYEGTWEGIRVAVKRMQIENFDLAEKEIDHLRASDFHPNIVRYYTNKRSDKFIYIALELCPATLEQVIVHGAKEPYSHLAGRNLQKQYALSQIASGLQFLHSLKIVHRDLKPQNILVAPPKLIQSASTGSPLWRHYKQDQTRCLISDFGLCKKLEPDHSTFQAQSTMAAGTSGWRAPEVLRGVENQKNPAVKDATSVLSDSAATEGTDRRITRAVDIFSMGCLFYYVLTDGEHPFGSLTYLRDGRIMDNQFDLGALDCSTNDGVEARDLITRMISSNPADRPNATKVLEHPYFWDEKRRTDFILEFSDRLNLEPRDPPTEIVQRVESASAEICGKDWTRSIDDAFMKDSKVNRSYHGKKINDLIRLIRNKKNHNHDLPDTLRKRLNEFEPGGYIGYFLYKRFPKLLLHLYYICEDETLGIAREAWYQSFVHS